MTLRDEHFTYLQLRNERVEDLKLVLIELILALKSKYVNTLYETTKKNILAKEYFLLELLRDLHDTDSMGLEQSENLVRHFNNFESEPSHGDSPA
jgi:uncharacterized protein (UPF0305 family)